MNDWYFYALYELSLCLWNIKSFVGNSNLNSRNLLICTLNKGGIVFSIPFKRKSHTAVCMCAETITTFLPIWLRSTTHLYKAHMRSHISFHNEKWNQVYFHKTKNNGVSSRKVKSSLSFVWIKFHLSTG